MPIAQIELDNANVFHFNYRRMHCIFVFAVIGERGRLQEGYTHWSKISVNVIRQSRTVQWTTDQINIVITLVPRICVYDYDSSVVWRVAVCARNRISSWSHIVCRYRLIGDREAPMQRPCANALTGRRWITVHSVCLFEFSKRALASHITQKWRRRRPAGSNGPSVWHSALSHTRTHTCAWQCNQCKSIYAERKVSKSRCILNAKFKIVDYWLLPSIHK